MSSKPLSLDEKKPALFCSIPNIDTDKVEQAQIPPQLIMFPLLNAITNNRAFTAKYSFYNARLTILLQLLLTITLLGLLTLLLLRLQAKRKQSVLAAKTIRESEERLKLALWASGDGMWDWDIHNNTVFRSHIANPKLFGKNNQTLLSIMHPQDKPRVEQLLKQHLNSESIFFEAEYRIEQAQDQWIWLLDRGKVVERDSQNTPIRMAGIHKDISARREIENKLWLSAQVLQSMSEAVIIGDINHQVISVNPAFSQITGFNFEHIVDKHLLEFAFNPQARSQYKKILFELSTNHYWSGESCITHRDGSQILTWLEVNKIYDENGKKDHFVAIFTDISARKKAEENLRLLANYDTLTGLPNRSLFHDRLKHAIDKAKRTHSLIALLFIDLDRFKFINDSMGHHIGDLLLKLVAQRLQDIIREGDTVARLGGDEFIIILENLSNTSAAESVAEKLIQTFKAPFILDGKKFVVSTSIGISLCPTDASNSELLVKSADTAMYYAKSQGRNNFQFYLPAMNEVTSRQLSLEAGLKEAIERDELYLVYQPKYTLPQHKLTGFETLLRWESNTLGSISPMEFIPVAEEIGMIELIGHWVLNQACQQLSVWHQIGHTDLTIAVNLSAKQLKTDLVSIVQAALAVANLPASALELEITESSIMKNPTDAVTIFTQLKELGISLAIDDFGTGYSSLSYLKHFPVDTLKIDKSFVHDIDSKKADATITTAIIALAKSLQLEVVAEGVENHKQLSLLTDYQCDQVQGFLFNKPLTPDECDHLFFKTAQAI
ncbi:sensor domain-containing protein [Shewanella hanedai]|uniref:sensor domain-containing protein n=1 Tax=Shewanella hanedai TaxID=25 RepID=UPI00163DACAA|nr:bifunctional diguanylate cyclase/phosphodiesterase [Shewanella hanedai]